MGRIYIPSCGISNFYTDIYGFKEYGYLKKEEVVFPLEGDMRTWWVWGIDQMFPDFAPWKRYLNRNEDIDYQNMTVNGKPMSIPIHIRRDPFYRLHTSLISKNRSEKPQKPIEYRPPDPSKSVFRPDAVEKVTPEPRIKHDNLHIEEGYIPITVPNLFAFIGHHLVNAFTCSRSNLSEFTRHDFENYLLIAKKNAKTMYNENACGMMSIMNFGETAAASQPWPHQQEGRMNPIMTNVNTHEVDTYLDMCRYIDNPNKYHMNVIRDSDLFIFESEYTLVFAPFAPKFPEQVDIILKPEVHNYLDLRKKYVKDIAQSIVRVLHSLYKERQVTDVNIVDHQTRFNEETGYRMHFHIYPRNKNKLGAAEIDELYVVDVFPETTATALKDAA